MHEVSFTLMNAQSEIGDIPAEELGTAQVKILKKHHHQPNLWIQPLLWYYTSIPPDLLLEWNDLRTISSRFH